MDLIIESSVLEQDGRPTEAALIIRQALVLARTLPSSDSTTEFLLARLTNFMGVREAELTLLEVLSDPSTDGSASGDPTFAARTALAALYERSGDPAAALRVIEDGLIQDIARVGRHSQRYRETAGQIARRAGRFEVAETYQREVLEKARQEVPSPRREVDLGDALKELARTLWAAGRRAEAEALFWEALEAHTRDIGANSLQVAAAWQNLATVKTSNGEDEVALAYRRQSLVTLLNYRCPGHREQSNWRIERRVRPELGRSPGECITDFPLVDFVTNLAQAEWEIGNRPAAATRLYIHGSDLVLGRNLARYSGNEDARAEYVAGQSHNRSLISASWEAAHDTPD